MAETANQQETSKVTKAVVPVIAILIAVIAVIVLINAAAGTTDEANNGMSRPEVNSGSSSTAPDPVKSDIPPNGDTNPSDTGTAPGGNNSPLGPGQP